MSKTVTFRVDGDQEVLSRLTNQNQVLLKEMLMLEWKFNKILEENELFLQEIERKDALITELKQNLEEVTDNARRDASNMVQQSDYNFLQELQRDTEKKLRNAEAEVASLQAQVSQHEDARAALSQDKDTLEQELEQMRGDAGTNDKAQEEFDVAYTRLKADHAIEVEQLQKENASQKESFEEQIRRLNDNIGEGHKEQQELSLKVQQLKQQASVAAQELREKEAKLTEEYERRLAQARSETAQMRSEVSQARAESAKLRAEASTANTSQTELALKTQQMEIELNRLREREQALVERERAQATKDMLMRQQYEDLLKRLRYAENMNFDKHLIDRLFDARVSEGIRNGEHHARAGPGLATSELVSSADSSAEHGQPRSRLLQHLAGVRVENMRSERLRQAQHRGHGDRALPARSTAVEGAEDGLPGALPMLVRHSYRPEEMRDSGVPVKEQLRLKKGDIVLMKYPSNRRDGFVRAQLASGEIGLAPRAFLEPVDEAAIATGEVDRSRRRGRTMQEELGAEGQHHPVGRVRSGKASRSKHPSNRRARGQGTSRGRGELKEGGSETQLHTTNDYSTVTPSETQTEDMDDDEHHSRAMANLRHRQQNDTLEQRQLLDQIARQQQLRASTTPPTTTPATAPATIAAATTTTTSTTTATATATAAARARSGVQPSFADENDDYEDDTGLVMLSRADLDQYGGGNDEKKRKGLSKLFRSQRKSYNPHAA